MGRLDGLLSKEWLFKVLWEAVCRTETVFLGAPSLAGIAHIHEGALLAGKRDNRTDQMGFFWRELILLHELNARRGRKGHIAAPCACRSKAEVFPHALDTRLPSLHLLNRCCP